MPHYLDNRGDKLHYGGSRPPKWRHEWGLVWRMVTRAMRRGLEDNLYILHDIQTYLMCKLRALFFQQTDVWNCTSHEVHSCLILIEIKRWTVVAVDLCRGWKGLVSMILFARCNAMQCSNLPCNAQTSGLPDTTTKYKTTVLLCL